MHIPGGIRPHNIGRRAAADPRLKPRGHRDRQALVARLLSDIRLVYHSAYDSNPVDYQLSKLKILIATS
jgi:hypothetical protein